MGKSRHGEMRASETQARSGSGETQPWGGDGGVREGMHDGAKKGVRTGILMGAEGGGGELRHTEARVPLHSIFK